MYVCMYVCKFIKLHITGQSGPVIPKGGISDTSKISINGQTRERVGVYLYVRTYVRDFYIVHNRAVRPCYPSHSMPLCVYDVY